MRRAGLTLFTALALWLSFPGFALAHGIGGRLDLPVPLQFFVAGAAVVLIVSFAALVVLWDKPKLQDGPEYRSIRRRRTPFGWILGLFGVAALILVIGQTLPPLLGLERDPTRPTIAPVMVWVVFWLVVPFLGAVIGNWYTDLNPWRVIGAPVNKGRLPPPRLGVIPATVAFVAVTWLELVSPGSGNPVALGWAALGYTIYLLIVVTLFDSSSAMPAFDAFTSYNRLISSIAPVGRTAEGKLVWRGWLKALPTIPEWRGLWIFVIAMIGAVTYDGAANTGWFTTITLGVGDTVLGATVLLVATIGMVAIAYLAACWAAVRLSNGAQTASGAAQRFAHTLAPIALAYAFAHYFTLVIFEGQQMIAAISDPFGLGWDLFGTADRRIDFFITATEPIWYAQVASIVGGHVLGVTLAHDRALADFGADAVRSQYAMLVLMVGLTTLGLTILAG